MPEFLGRPNLPNELANTLVQLAAHMNDPIAAGIKNFGESIGGAMEERGKRAHEKELKAMEIASAREQKQFDLVGRIIDSNYNITPGESSTPLDKSMAAKLIGMDFPEAGNKKSEVGIASEKFGRVLPKGYRVIPKEKRSAVDANRYVQVDQKMIGNFPALKDLEGKDISTAQYINLIRMNTQAEKYRGDMNNQEWTRAMGLAKNDMTFMSAAMEGDEKGVEQTINKYRRLVRRTGGSNSKGSNSGELPGKRPLADIIGEALGKAISE